MFEKICQDVYMVGGAELSDPSDCLCYAVDLGNPVLIDCGCGPGWQAIKHNMHEAGMDAENLHTLLITHAHVDHMGALALTKRETKCRVVAHALDAEAIENADERRTAADWYHIKLEPTQVDIKVEGSSHTLEFPKGQIHLLHTPGHTPGSMVAWMDTAEGRVLFGQDIHGPFSPVFGSDIPSWRDSMQKLLDLHADILCEGHFGIFRGKREISEFIESHLRRH